MMKRGSGERRPMPPAMLAEIAGEIPDTLAAWLAWDTQSPNGELSLMNEDGLALREAEDLLEELVTSESEGEDWEEDTREAMRELALQLPGQLLLLRAPSDQDHFLYIGSARNQAPVLVLEHEELTVGWSSFEAYVGELDGLVEADDEERAACTRMQKSLFG